MTLKLLSMHSNPVSNGSLLNIADLLIHVYIYAIAKINLQIPIVLITVFQEFCMRKITNLAILESHTNIFY